MTRVTAIYIVFLPAPGAHSALHGASHTLRDRVNPSSLHIPGISDTADMSKLRGAGAPAKMYKLQPGWAGVDISYLSARVTTPVNTWLRNVNEGQYYLCYYVALTDIIHT